MLCRPKSRRKCPALYHKKKLGLIEDEDRPAYLIGRALHTLALEGRERFEAEYAVGGPINPKTGEVYIADFLGNAVHKVCPKTGAVTTIMKNGNTTGRRGRLVSAARSSRRRSSRRRCSRRAARPATR